MPGDNYTLPLEETIALVRQFPLPQFKLKPFFPDQTISGDVARWTLYPNARTRADYTAFSAPARRVARKPMSHMAVQMAHIREGKYIGAAAKRNRKPGSNATNEKWAVEDQIADEMEDLVNRIEYRKEFERASVLFGGVISVVYEDGTMYKVDFLTSTAAHYQSSISVWSAAGADILGDIDSMVHACRINGGIDPVYLLGGEGLLSNMIKNTALQGFWQRSPYGMRAIEDGQLPRLKGLTVIEYTAGYDDGTGTWAPFVPAGFVAVFGQPAECGMVTLHGEADDLAASGNPGRFAKSWETEDPSGIHVVVDDVSMAGIEVPRGVCVMDAW